MRRVRESAQTIGTPYVPASTRGISIWAMQWWNRRYPAIERDLTSKHSSFEIGR